MVRYYSDVTKKFYDEPKECEEAEKLFKEEKAKKEAEALQKSNARKEASKKVEEAREKLIAARDEYQKVLSDFCKEYGYYHVSLDKNNIADWIDSFWERWF